MRIGAGLIFIISMIDYAVAYNETMPRLLVHGCQTRLSENRVTRSTKIRMEGLPPRERLKQTAIRLFADKGIERVGVREIADAAGFKNCGSLRHYFGTKDSLVLELGREGVQKVNSYRFATLERLETEGQVSVRDALILIIAPPTDALVGYPFLRFFRNIRLERPELMAEILDDATGDPIRRCTEHILQHLDHLPEQIALDRIDLCYEFLFDYNAAIASKSSANDRSTHWRTEHFRQNMFDTAEAMLTAPVSAETRAAYRQAAIDERVAQRPRAG